MVGEDLPQPFPAHVTPQSGRLSNSPTIALSVGLALNDCGRAWWFNRTWKWRPKSAHSLGSELIHLFPKPARFGKRLCPAWRAAPRRLERDRSGRRALDHSGRADEVAQGPSRAAVATVHRTAAAASRDRRTGRLRLDARCRADQPRHRVATREGLVDDTSPRPGGGQSRRTSIWLISSKVFPASSTTPTSPTSERS